ncbi:4Fe-4S binding protein [Dehalobacter sp. DCM]|uniref:4Fe-4S dicluster domain-containing protein n=1 Tax=Dehalobacter sp. DCM TaxID=2907827 RepID=UPI0030820381|nr:4Fe-4S binding protein [Dehalobacter sp. DCM]
MSSDRYGLLIDYEFCTGCHACEVACKKELNLVVGQWGLKVYQDGPRKLENGKWEYNFLPVPTSLCNLCADRVKEGRKPTCVHHCQAGVIEYGTLQELSKKMNEKPKTVMYSK